MSLIKTLPALLALAWIATPFVLEAAAEAPRPAAAKSAVETKVDRIADAFAIFAEVPAPRTVTIETRDEANRTSTLTRMPLVETASN